MKQERKFQGVWIPAELWLAEGLSITEKCLLVEINSLDNDEERGCFASNEYLGKFLGLSAGRVANMISDLKKRGYIVQVYFDGRNRGLRLHENMKNLHENVKAALTKSLKQPSRKREHINTYSSIDEESFVVFDENDPAYLVTTVALERIEENVTDPAPAAPRLAKKKVIAPHVDEVIAYLNTKAETAFRPSTKSTISAINARIDDGYTVADFKAVIDCKAAQWKGDAEMHRYLRPETLFRPAHFESYLNEARRAPAANTDAALIDLPGLDEESAGQYGRFIVHVQEHYPALWRSACRVFSQSEYFDYLQNKSIPGVGMNLTTEEKRGHLARVMKELSASEGKRKQYGTVWQAYETTMRALLNGKKIEI